MKRFRISIKSIMFFVLFAALAVGALARRTHYWASVTHWVTLGFLCLAVAGTTCRVGGKRQFWLGCALFGWVNYLLAFPLAVLDTLPKPPIYLLNYYIIPMSPFSLPETSYKDTLPFYVIMNSFWVIANGFLGGLVARHFVAKDPLPESPKGPNDKKPYRVSIPLMMAVVLFVALTVASLTRPTPLAASLLHWLTLGLLCVAIVGTSFQAGGKWRFWLGYALFGTVNYMLAFPLLWLDIPYLPIGLTDLSRIPLLAPNTFDDLETYESIVNIAGSLWVIANGFLGGLVARYFFAKEPPA